MHPLHSLGRRRLLSRGLVATHPSPFRPLCSQHSQPTSSRHCQARDVHARRRFHTTRKLQAVKPFLLADIGEGITECELIQWFVHPPARVEQFDKLCEVQSDKASVEITSRYDGVVRKLYVEAGEMAVVGKPLVDIEIPDEVAASEDDGPLNAVSPPVAADQAQPRSAGPSSTAATSPPSIASHGAPSSRPGNKHATLATPAVRHLTKSLSVNLSDVTGTGKEGRVMKEDVHRFAQSRHSPSTPATPTTTPTSASLSDLQPIPLSPIQTTMYRTMTGSLSIPHFLYTETIDLSRLTALLPTLTAKLTLLPFILKALSALLPAHPLLTALLLPPHTPQNPTPQPVFLARPPHTHISLAIATASGLVAPVLRHVERQSIAEIAAEIARLKTLAATNRLAQSDVGGGVFTVSNIGAVGAGGVVAGRVVEGQVAMLGVGRAETRPVWVDGRVEGRQTATFSWAADHRVVDGAEVARFSGEVRRMLETPEEMLVLLR